MLLRFLRISGHSMEPTIPNRSIVIVSSLPYFFTKPKKGDIILFQKNNKNMVKRITRIEKEKYFVQGDNKKDSLDSRNFGHVLNEEIEGKVIFVLDK